MILGLEVKVIRIFSKYGIAFYKKDCLIKIKD
jgi:hypothetical protein